MVKLYLINKKLAILLKEAEFKDDCTYYYEKLNIPENEKYIAFNFNVLKNRYSAPLISHVISWLDDKNIFINIIPNKTNIGVSFNYKIITEDKNYCSNKVFNHRIEALNEALEIGIKLHIKTLEIKNKEINGINN